jgi:hypothetical protein
MGAPPRAGAARDLYIHPKGTPSLCGCIGRAAQRTVTSEEDVISEKLQKSVEHITENTEKIRGRGDSVLGAGLSVNSAVLRFSL